MVGEAVQNYVNLVSGLTKATRAKAAAGARAVLSQTGLEDVTSDASRRVSTLADEILAASKANRALLRNLVATEVEQVVGRLGLTRAEELERLRAEVHALADQLAARPASRTNQEDDRGQEGRQGGGE